MHFDVGDKVTPIVIFVEYEILRVEEICLTAEGLPTLYFCYHAASGAELLLFEDEIELFEEKPINNVWADAF